MCLDRDVVGTGRARRDVNGVPVVGEERHADGEDVTAVRACDMRLIWAHGTFARVALLHGRPRR